MKLKFDDSDYEHALQMVQNSRVALREKMSFKDIDAIESALTLIIESEQCKHDA